MTKPPTRPAGPPIGVKCNDRGDSRRGACIRLPSPFGRGVGGEGDAFSESDAEVGQVREPAAALTSVVTLTPTLSRREREKARECPCSQASGPSRLTPMAGPPSRSARDTQHPLVLIVRDKLAGLGDFVHLVVYRQGDHLFIAHAGPPDGRDEVDPVLRITHVGRWRFGLSLRRSNGRWQPLPIAGAMVEVIAEAVRTFGPWLAPRDDIRDTSGTDY